ncbi:MAG: trehalose-6-phosphate synthase [Mycobacteriales bacterium]
MTTDDAKRPVVAVANRLPVHAGDDGWQLSPGGLVTALRPVMSVRSGAWVGWDGGTKDTPARLPELSIGLAPVSLTATQVRDYYHGFANRTLWPLLHHAIEKPVFERSWWAAYRSVNERFSAAAVEALDSNPEALLWVHDYHLLLVPELVRQERGAQRTGLFLHTPWPSPDIFARIPWRKSLLLGPLGADVVSFHTEGYRRNFVRACGRLLGGDGVQVKDDDLALPDGRLVRTTVSPISIDVAQFADLGTSPRTDEEVRALRQQFAGRTVLLGVDRLDYTKGIVERLRAFEALLERRPDLRDQLVLVQVAVPSRDDVREYRQLRSQVEQITGRINGRFTAPGRDVPVHYLYRSLTPEALSAYYACADVMLVTPLVDGMNLVAKEYVAVQNARRSCGALVLSEFTGAAHELEGAVLCNPFDIDGLSSLIEQALVLPEATRRRAMSGMARQVTAHDVHHWVDLQLADIGAEGPGAVPD